MVVLERDEVLGGILNQCIHDGFGLRRYQRSLTGPAYAARSIAEAEQAGVEFRSGSMVTGMTADRVVTAVSRKGLDRLQGRTVILATGCRERTRGTLSIPGPRPAGIYTAGVVQNLVNCKNILPGRRVVILGSGDIGLIMARRLTLEGAQVLGVVEIMPEPGGLTRNVSQCVLDYDIPLYLEHTVSRVIGKKRLEAVEIAKVDADKRIIPGTERLVACDTLVLSVGLIPENEVAKSAGVALDPAGNGTVTDAYLQTSVPGVFSCGNSRNLVDFVDSVSQQGELAGQNAARYIRGEAMEAWTEQARQQQHHGMPRPGSVICPLCPNGCEVAVDAAGAVSGNRCDRGAAFALQEKQRPMRVLTTTVRVAGGREPLLPVRSASPVPKSELLSTIRQLHLLSLQAPVAPGAVVASGVGESQVEIIAESSAQAAMPERPCGVNTAPSRTPDAGRGQHMWKCTEYEERYMQQILAMTLENYGEEDDISHADYLHHQYFENPSGDAVIELAVDPESGELAGQYIVCPMRFLVREKQVRCVNSLNTLTREAYRGQGIFAALAESVYGRSAEQGYRFCYGMPNPNSHAGFLKKLGFSELSRIPLMLKPLRPSQMVREFLHSTVLSYAARPADALFRIRERETPLKIVEVTDGQLGDVDRFWQGVKGKYPVMNIRDADFVRYRFLRMPRRPYHSYLGFEKGEPVCFAVARITEVAGMQCAMLLDFLFWDGHAQAAAQLLGHVLAQMQQVGACLAGCRMLGHTQEAGVLRENGFFRCPKKLEPQPFPLIFRPFDGCPEEECLRDIGNWFFTMGDYDAV